MIVLDTSVLIDALSGAGRSAPALRGAIANAERIAIPGLVLFEWLRGPRVAAELEAQEALLPSNEALEFGPAEAAISAKLYRGVARPRGRELDLAIAAHALARGSLLWTLNRDDFSDLPGLGLFEPTA